MSAQVHVVRYGAPALDALRDVVADLKRHDPMRRVTVLVPNNVAGIVARRHLAHGLSERRRGIVAIRFTTLRHLAEELASPALVGAGRRPATSALTAAAVRSCLDDDPGTFARVAGHPATARALARAHLVLRDLDPDALATMAGVSSLAADVVRLHLATVTRLDEAHYDTADLLRTAALLVRQGGAATDELGALVLYLPQDLNRGETDLLRALTRMVGAPHVVAGVTGGARADAAVVGAVAAASVAPERAVLPGVHEQPTAQRILTASDSDDEVRCVVREVVAALRHHPAHRLAVLHTSAAPYARLLHEHLAAAGITVNGPGVRTVVERATVRLALGLLETARTGWRRGNLLRTLGEVPVTTFDGERVSVSRWERVSREAGVVEGDDWDAKVATYAVGQAREAGEAEYESRRQHAERNRESAEQLRAFVGELRHRFGQAAALTSWRDLGTWMLTLVGDLLADDQARRLPVEELYALSALRRSLSGLAALDTQSLATGLLALEEALVVDLESALPRVGRFGEGVLVAPVSQAVGLDLDEVWVVGVSEDLYPGRLHEDSLLPERVRDSSLGQLPSTRASLDTRQRHLLAAFDVAARVTASFPRGDLRRHTQRLPSRWLLPTLRALSGDDTLPATKWQDVVAGSEGWLHSSPSFSGSILTSGEPSTATEWRMRQATAAGDLDDETVRVAKAVLSARRSEAFTRFDGNLACLEGLPDFTHGERAVSPTSLERYAICPHAWFIQRVLYVEPVESPEEAVEITSLDVGNIVHQSFDELVTEAGAADELPDYGQPWSTAQRARLREIGAAIAARYEAEGKVGHERLWPSARQRILDTLDWMVEDDNAWRAELDARVIASEIPFGLRGTEPVTVALPDGGTVTFRGSADKVDQTRDGTLLVTDIKTGSDRTFKTLKVDPVSHGEKLQLPVYAMAARQTHGAPETPVKAMYWFVQSNRGRIEVGLTPAVGERYAAALGVLTRGIAHGAFPPRAPEDPDFRWVQCQYCNPDGLGHGDVRRGWERKRLSPALVDYTGLVEGLPVESDADHEGGDQ